VKSQSGSRNCLDPASELWGIVCPAPDCVRV
jgi:hypothetical protein